MPWLPWRLWPHREGVLLLAAVVFPICFSACGFECYSVCPTHHAIPGKTTKGLLFPIHRRNYHYQSPITIEADFVKCYYYFIVCNFILLCKCCLICLTFYFCIQIWNFMAQSLKCRLPVFWLLDDWHWMISMVMRSLGTTWSHLAKHEVIWHNMKSLKHNIAGCVSSMAVLNAIIK